MSTKIIKRNIENVSNNTRSKKPKLYESLVCEKSFVFATQLKHFMSNDTLSDYLEFINGKNKNYNDFDNFIMKSGIEFENKIVDYIDKNKFNVVKVSDRFSDLGCKDTIKYMKLGIPILHSAPVKNLSNNTGGIIDLLVRSDYINKIFDNFPISDKETKIRSPLLKTNYHYIVIDIKFMTMNLTSKNDNLLNSNNIPFYKAQCLIYTKAVSKIQGYCSRYAFILGRGWKNKSKGTNSNYSLNKLGKIDYKVFDSKIVNKTKKAVSWIRKLRKKGDKWDLKNTLNSELFPNMCNISNYQKEKQKICEEKKDITQIWNCTIKNRNLAFSQKIYSWNDIKCNSKTLGIKGKNAKLVDKIININRQDKQLILPEKINNNMFGWKNKNSNNVFVDFETFTDIFDDFSELPYSKKSKMIFMIGVGYTDNSGNWIYKNFTCLDKNYTEEYRIMNEFIEFLESKGNPNLYHWSPAEKSFWKNAEERQFKLNKNNPKKLENIISNFKLDKFWCDFAKFFKESEIVIKGCFNYGLKNIAKSMFNNNMITTHLESDCDSGLSAMIKANTYYKNIVVFNHIIKDIKKYNQFDCKVMCDIFNYIKKNMV